jgi:hypothetical protein
MKLLTRTINARTCPEAWLNAFEFLSTQPEHEFYNLILAIESPALMTPQDFRLHDLVDTFLRSHNEEPIATVAGTIFPGNYYLRDGARGVYEIFPDEVFPKLEQHSWGTYAMRMLRRKGKDGEAINPLKIMVAKLQNQMKKETQRMRLAYEMNLTDTDDDAFEMPIYRPSEDANRFLQQPCLSHLTFKLQPPNNLILTVMYRSHFYISKTLGNLLGLAQLQSFVAAEANLEVGPLICHSTHARIDTGASWTLTEVRQLLSERKSALLPTVA